jgi:hypothetical protein
VPKGPAGPRLQLRDWFVLGCSDDSRANHHSSPMLIFSSVKAAAQLLSFPLASCPYGTSLEMHHSLSTGELVTYYDVNTLSQKYRLQSRLLHIRFCAVGIFSFMSVIAICSNIFSYPDKDVTYADEVVTRIDVSSFYDGLSGNSRDLRGSR